MFRTQAWSRIVHTLIPNAAVLSKHLSIFAEACSATEVVLFERTTFLVVATSAAAPPAAALPESPQLSPSQSTPSSHTSLLTSNSQSSYAPAKEPDGPTDLHALEPTRYERTSELVKAFKHACSRMRSEFHALEFEFPEFTAVLDELTKNMYVLVIVHDPTIGELYFAQGLATWCSWLLAETAALKMNIQLARRKFEELQGDSLVG